MGSQNFIINTHITYIMVNKHFIGYSLFSVLAVGLGVALIVTNVNGVSADVQDGPVCCSTSSSGNFDTNACSADIEQLQANGWTYNETQKKFIQNIQSRKFQICLGLDDCSRN